MGPESVCRPSPSNSHRYAARPIYGLCRFLAASPSFAAALITGIFLATVLCILSPGYWINDDPKIIWNIIGYPGSGETVPFMIYSNVLPGLILAALFNAQPDVNWYSWLLVAVNGMAAYAMLQQLVGSRKSSLPTWAPVAVLIGGWAILMLNMTYTVSALLAAVAGAGVLFGAALGHSRQQLALGALGVCLIVLGSLLRLSIALLCAAIAAPLVLALEKASQRRFFALAALVASIGVFGGFAVDRLYVRNFQEWNAFYAYTDARQKLHDSHVLRNTHGEIRRVGWTPNDQELFARWHFPDEARYSYEKLRYLVNHVPGVSRDPWGSANEYLKSLLRPQTLVFPFWMLAIAWWLLTTRVRVRTAMAAASIWLLALAANLILAISYKDPSYVLASTLAGSTALSLLVLRHAPDAQANDVASRASASGNGRLRTGGLAFFIGTGMLAATLNLLGASRLNSTEKAAYDSILGDLQALQMKGQLSPIALIVSPAHGLPYAWSDPFEVDRPTPEIFDTGWITFSPTYDRVLAQYEIEDLSAALLDREDVYLMSSESLIVFLSRHYAEHERMRVAANIIYRMPNPSRVTAYDNIVLYQLRPVH